MVLMMVLYLKDLDLAELCRYSYEIMVALNVVDVDVEDIRVELTFPISKELRRGIFH